MHGYLMREKMISLLFLELRCWSIITRFGIRGTRVWGLLLSVCTSLSLISFIKTDSDRVSYLLGPEGSNFTCPSSSSSSSGPSSVSNATQSHPSGAALNAVPAVSWTMIFMTLVSVMGVAAYLSSWLPSRHISSFASYSSLPHSGELKLKLEREHEPTQTYTNWKNVWLFILYNIICILQHDP